MPSTLLPWIAAAAAFHSAPHASHVALSQLPALRRHRLAPVAVAESAPLAEPASSADCTALDPSLDMAGCLVPDDEPTPPDDDWLRSAAPVLALCCAIAAICALDRVVMSVAILPMSDQLGYTDEQKGLIASAFSVGYCISQLPSGTVASLTSPKAVLLGGLVFWSAAQAVSPSAAVVSLPALLGARAIMGAGEAAAVPSLQAVAAKFVPAQRRSLFWGVLSASLSVRRPEMRLSENSGPADGRERLLTPRAPTSRQTGTIASYLVAPPLIARYAAA